MSDAMPTPSPALRKLDRLVGTWEMRGSLVGSDEEDIVGEATFRGSPGPTTRRWSHRTAGRSLTASSAA